MLSGRCRGTGGGVGDCPRDVVDFSIGFDPWKGSRGDGCLVPGVVRRTGPPGSGDPQPGTCVRCDWGYKQFEWTEKGWKDGDGGPKDKY